MVFDVDEIREPGHSRVKVRVPLAARLPRCQTPQQHDRSPEVPAISLEIGMWHCVVTEGLRNAGHMVYNVDIS